MTIFEKLANSTWTTEVEAELQAFGLAGQCGVLSLRGQYEESNRVLGQLAAHPTTS